MARLEFRRPDLAKSILIVGAIAHALLCIPAIDCRGYPPLDPIWYGVTFLWPMAIVISAYFDSIRFGSRWKHLFIYAIVTAFFSAATAVIMVPRQMGLALTLFHTAFLIPVYLLVIYALEYASQFLYSFGRRLDVQTTQSSNLNPSRFSILMLVCWIGLTLGIPIGYRSYEISQNEAFAIWRADQAWLKDAVIFRDWEPQQIDNCSIEYWFDLDTGLELRQWRPDLNFCEVYNARIHELIKQHGIPSYSIRPAIPQPTDLIAYLDSDQMDLVTSLPIELTQTIHLIAEVPTRHQQSSSSSNNRPGVTPITTIELGGNNPIYTKIVADTIYIRNGHNQISAYFKNGRLIAEASRTPR